RSTLRNYPFTIDIQIHEDNDDWYVEDWTSQEETLEVIAENEAKWRQQEKLGEVIAAMLTTVKNLVHLSLDMLQQLSFDPIFRPDWAPYPFMLRTLRIQAPSQPDFDKFPKPQSHIEKLFIG
ncbi:hypothetical protein FRC07_006859, partial [Ceratobasidium sp. 392]